MFRICIKGSVSLLDRGVLSTFELGPHGEKQVPGRVDRAAPGVWGCSWVDRRPGVEAPVSLEKVCAFSSDPLEPRVRLLNMKEGS